MKLRGKVALISGAGRGIGRAVALAYAREGAKLALCARTASEVETVAAEARSLNAEAKAWACDVSQEDPVARLIADASGRFGRIDVLVNNAGVMTRASSTADLEVKKWDYVITVNLRGPFLLSRAVLPIMMKQKSGSIINVSSMLGRSSYTDYIAYSSSKWGLEGFTQVLAAEVRSDGIRVNSVDPGTVATKLTGFMGNKPEAVTDVFVYLASDESKAVTGKALSSSGWKSQMR
jgi:NAD(P)-dependent dehydrogenase (short-subunit alcohol dehydrogenase family)